jgi:chemotaxis protein methyltransferase CheR
MPSHDVLLSQITRLIEQRTGLTASTQLHAEIDGLARQAGKGNLEVVFKTLQAHDETAALWQQILRALTIGETYFVRDAEYFRLLRENILPGLILARRRQGRFFMDIWSAGCSTGEETYSIALVLSELLPDLSQWTIRLVGTDINLQALEQARLGIYRAWAFRQTEDIFQPRYFTPVENGWQIKPEIREMVSFRQGNLLNDAPMQRCDIILCRNVLIYLTDEAIKTVENRLFDTLTPGGWLVMGQSETIRFQRERWITHIFSATMLHQKPTTNTPHHHPITLHRPVPQHKPPSTYADAVSAMRTEQVEESERILLELLAKHPNTAEAHTLLAAIYANRQNLDGARQHIHHALRLNPLLADAHYLQAVVLLEEGLDYDAQRALRAALYSQNDHPLAAFMLGNLQVQTGEVDKALRTWENARQMLKTRPPSSYLSDLSDVTVFGMDILLSRQIERWKA